MRPGASTFISRGRIRIKQAMILRDTIREFSAGFWVFINNLRKGWWCSGMADIQQRARAVKADMLDHTQVLVVWSFAILAPLSSGFHICKRYQFQRVTELAACLLQPQSTASRQETTAVYRSLHLLTASLYNGKKLLETLIPRERK